MGLFGGGDVFGRKPKYGTTQESAARAIEANLTNLPKAQELAGNVNQFNLGQQMAMLRKVLPGFDKFLTTGADLYQSRIEGKFSESELDQLQLAAASKGVEGGTLGSQFDKARLARNLGLNAWQETQKALSSYTAWHQNIAQLTQPAMFNVGSAFVPYEAQQQWDKLKAENDAAPVPKKRGNVDTHLGLVGMATSGYAGGAGYANSYRAPYQQAPSGAAPQYAPQWNTVQNSMAPSSPGYGSGGPYE